MNSFYDPKTKRSLNDPLLRLPRHDLFFGTPENRPGAGLPIGDGDTGSLLWLEKDGIRVHINKCDLWQDAPPGVTWNDDCYCSGHEEELTCVKHAGEISIRFDSPVFEYLYQQRFTARLSLSDAAVRLDSVTPFGSVKARAFAENGVTVLSCGVTSQDGEAPRIRLARWGSRTLWRWYAMQKFAPETGLDGTQASADGDTLYITQALSPTKFCLALRLVCAGPYRSERLSRHAAAFLPDKAETHEFALFWTVKTGGTTEEARERCERALDEASAAGEAALFEAHRAAWAAFWRRSYIELPDDYLENIYDLYLYYMNSESRGAYPPHFTSGLWGFYHDYIPWNYYFHYNEQHMYAPLDAAGHGELADCYYRLRGGGMEKNRRFAELVKGTRGIFLHDVTDRFGRGAEYHHMNCAPGAQVAMQMWRHWRYTGDEDFLQHTALPFMRESVIFYLDLLHKEADGLYHLHDTSAYESNEVADDVCTDLTMIRTLLPTYLPYADAALRERMEDALAHLPAPLVLPMRVPEDWDGETISFGVGKGRRPLGDASVFGVGTRGGEPLRKSFGDPDMPTQREAFPDVELAPLYPSGLLGLKDRGTALWDTLQNQLWLHRTADRIGHWNMLPIFQARMGDDGLYETARTMLSRYQGFPNGMNAEEGEPGTLMRDEPAFYTFRNVGRNEKNQIRSDDFIHFDFETAPIIAMALQQGLLQSHEGLLRLCPAAGELPVSFRLWAEGGFTVEMCLREDGFVLTVESARGEPCYLCLPSACEQSGIYAYIAKQDADFAPVPVGYTVRGTEKALDLSALKAGETLLLSSVPIGALTPAAPPPSEANDHMKTCGRAVLGSPALMRP